MNFLTVIYRYHSILSSIQIKLKKRQDYPGEPKSMFLIDICTFFLCEIIKRTVLMVEIYFRYCISFDAFCSKLLFGEIFFGGDCTA